MKSNLALQKPPVPEAGDVNFSIGDSVLYSNRGGESEWLGEIIGYTVASDTDSDSESNPEAAHTYDKLFDIKLR